MSRYGHLSAPELVDRILAKFAGATALSKITVNDEEQCFYAPIINGIGCGIGCLLPAEVGTAWDLIGDIDDVRLMEPEQYARWFSDEQLEMLEDIQWYHDVAEDVAGFLRSLRLKVALQWPNFQGKSPQPTTVA